jgi:EAL domain-containing protein (putative c-di-GMP-specific phosphodiesterase class I)
MSHIQRPSYDDPLVRGILDAKSVSVEFQPVCSARKRQVVGMEALTRGINPTTGEVVPPGMLFGLAEASNLIVELDQLCRKKALEQFKQLKSKHPGLLLFLNFEAAIIERGISSSGHLIHLAKELEARPEDIVIELVASRALDMEVLEEFVERYKQARFNIALGDMGAGHASLERVALLKPDVLKVDRVVMHGIDQHFHKQEVLRSVINLSRKTGSLVIAEGMETEEEALTALALGVDLVEGPVLAKPAPLEQNSAFDEAQAAIEKLCSAYVASHVTKMRAKLDETRRDRAIVDESLAEAAVVRSGSFDTFLGELVRRHLSLECAFILNERGIQVSSTVFDSSISQPRKHFVFGPAERGTDHSLKEYFFLLQTGLTSYTTDPYISLASGNFCRTIAVPFTAADKNPYILCLDFIAQAV